MADFAQFHFADSNQLTIIWQSSILFKVRYFCVFMPIHAQQLAGFASGGIVFGKKSVVMHPLEGPVLWTHS